MFFAAASVDEDAQLLLRVDLLARIGVGRAGAFGGEHLDPVDTARQIGAHRAPQRIGVVTPPIRSPSSGKSRNISGATPGRT